MSHIAMSGTEIPAESAPKGDSKTKTTKNRNRGLQHRTDLKFQAAPISDARKKRKIDDELSNGSASRLDVGDSLPANTESLPAYPGQETKMQVLCGPMGKADAQTRLMGGKLVESQSKIAALEKQLASKDDEAKTQTAALEAIEAKLASMSFKHEAELADKDRKHAARISAIKCLHNAELYTEQVRNSDLDIKYNVAVEEELKRLRGIFERRDEERERQVQEAQAEYWEAKAEAERQAWESKVDAQEAKDKAERQKELCEDSKEVQDARAEDILGLIQAYQDLMDEFQDLVSRIDDGEEAERLAKKLEDFENENADIVAGFDKEMMAKYRKHIG